MPSEKSRSAWNLFLLSGVALFVEMFLIRWNPACVTLVGYYSNLVLIACFLGLGIGMAGLKKVSRWSSDFPFRFLILNLSLGLMGWLGVWPLFESWGEELWGIKIGLVPSYLIIPLVFVLNALAMIPLGKRIGILFEQLPSLPAYLWNLFGSLAGVILFGLVNWLFPNPLIFAGMGLLLYWSFLVLQAGGKRQLAMSGLILLLNWGLIFAAKGDSFWSPYYKLRMVPELKYFSTVAKGQGLKIPGAFVLEANDDFHQYGIDLSPAFLERVRRENPSAYPALRDMSQYYELPYQFLRHPGRVLILGAGCGNDASAAVRSGLWEIDAVEIDPTIAELGRTMHPEKPYLRPEVNVQIRDARNFLKRTDQKYDLIVYGFLDSHTFFSSLASVRLENFVYTREGIQEAARHLNPEGILVLAFASGKQFISQRLFWMVNRIFPGKTWSLYVLAEPDTGAGFELIVAGPKLIRLPRISLMTISDHTGWMLNNPPDKIPTDDWPFLYLQKSGIKSDYAKTLILLLLIGFFLVRRSLPDFKTLQGNFFFLGAGFLFLETKGITQLSLLFGSTWIVNLIVIAGFLVMGILSTALAFKIKPGSRNTVFSFLFAFLLFNFFFPWSKLLGLNEFLQAIIAGTLISLPVFFSGLIFALAFKQTQNSAQALGSNLLGATFGGFSEYLTMILGFQILWLIAIGFYLLALALGRKK